ncbi:MAG: hypothetical protein H6799_00235 [Candidatus Nomurabacteria bacterium]|nr:MAG: hypothetical protein H6799_00235 [Candidatus Nomurabacteria bacterium]HRV76020.1 hypothetical protein [Candidatus Saccharimonadales bacterium]
MNEGQGGLGSAVSDRYLYSAPPEDLGFTKYLCDRARDLKSPKVLNHSLALCGSIATIFAAKSDRLPKPIKVLAIGASAAVALAGFSEIENAHRAEEALK